MSEPLVRNPSNEVRFPGADKNRVWEWAGGGGSAIVFGSWGKFHSVGCLGVLVSVSTTTTLA